MPFDPHHNVFYFYRGPKLKKNLKDNLNKNEDIQLENNTTKALITQLSFYTNRAGNYPDNYEIPDTPNPPDPPTTPDPPDPPQTHDWEVDGQGTVTYIVDGDTYDLSSVGRIRLADVDTPEQGESGYQEAKSYLSSLIDGKTVYIDIDDVYQTDIYGRTVAVTYVRFNSTHLLNVNEDLLVQGLATILNYPNEFDPYSWSLHVYFT